MINWLKIRQIGILQLIIIVFFKLEYKLILFKEKISLYLGKKYVFTGLSSNFKHVFIHDRNPYNHFRKYCVFGAEVVEEANLILKNQIKLYETYYLINQDWLSDPLTKQKVDAYTFFADSSVCLNQGMDVKLVMELNKLYHLVVLACAYDYTKEEKYIYKIEEDINSWRKEVRYESGVINKIIMDLAYRNLNLIYVCILCQKSDYFQEKIYPYIVNILYWQNLSIEKFATPKWFKTGNASNHTVGEMVGYIVTTLWLSGQLRGMKINLDWAFQYLNQTLEKLVTANGVYLEQSFNYSKIVFDFLFILDIGMKDVEYTHALYNRKYLLKLENYLSLLLGDDFSPNFGDNDSSRVILPFYYSDHYLNRIECKGNFLHDVKSGQVIWHSKEGADIHLFLRCGEFSVYKLGVAVHCHCDILSLLLSLKGRKIFVDRGTSYYNRQLDFRNQDRSSLSHNCISFEGLEQAQMNGKWTYGSYPFSRVEKAEGTDSVFQFIGRICYGKSVLRREINYRSAEFEVVDTLENFFSQKCYLNYILEASLLPRQVDNNVFYISDGTEDLVCMIFDERINVTIENAEVFDVYSKKKITKKIFGSFFIEGASSEVYKTIVRIL